MNIIIQSIRKDGFKKIMIGNKEREEIKKHPPTLSNSNGEYDAWES